MCSFCAIAAKEKPAVIVLEEEEMIAFLDYRPLFWGHSLLIPRRHYETMSDLPARLIGPLFQGARRLSIAMEEGLQAAGSFVAVNNKISQSVPHVHVHVVPRRPKDGLRGFFWPRTRYDSDEQAHDVAARLRAALEAGPNT
ncbi:MAG: HIT domain-containing protein [Actinomycetota bacterium]|nr:HIT domain-containing protein [Actinomycetota bacterium]